MKTHMLSAALLLTTTKAFAWCVVCFPNTGNCHNFPNKSCNEMSGAGGICFTLGPKMYRPSTDYVLSENGRAWIVQGDGNKRTPFATDNMVAFMALMNAKYPKKDDPKSKSEIEAAWADFLKKPDTSTVPEKRVAEFAKVMGLSVRKSDKVLGK